MWKDGIIHFSNMLRKDTYVNYRIKVYNEPIGYGIKGWGKIAKLELKIKDELVAQYDGEWTIEPTCEAANMASTLLIADYN